MATSNKASMITGTVIDQDDGKGIEGLIVEALDKDLKSDTRLGNAKTDASGSFTVYYDKEEYRKQFAEQKPDVFLRVKNNQGKLVFTTEDTVRYEADAYETYTISLSRKLVLGYGPEMERIQYKKLISLNPNYFGTLSASGIKKDLPVITAISQNTAYEKLACVGLHPGDDLLEAVLEIKLPYGYGGSLCTPGSHEYVAFYIDYGTGYVSTGAAVQVNVHDIIKVNERHLFYAVRKPFIPRQILKCSTPQIVKVRAILSWNHLPTGPGYIPVWGNVLDASVQIRPKQQIIFKPVPGVGWLKKPSIPEFIPKDPIPGPDPVEQIVISGDKESITEFVAYSVKAFEDSKKDLEPERVDCTELIRKNPNYFGSISMAKKPLEVLSAVSKLPDLVKVPLIQKLAVNPEFLLPVVSKVYNTSYEELHCVGLFPEEDLLEAVIEIKKPGGYNSGLCGWGSTEYVAFYIDWGLGWEYAATATVPVHDIPAAGKEHLQYAVHANIPDILGRLKHCSAENIVKVKAILSWNIDPTPYGESYAPGWGNVLQRYIQVRAVSGPSTLCSISIVNDVHVGEISQSGAGTGYAYDTSDLIPPLTYNRPFGNILAIWGSVNIAAATWYRFRYSSDGGATWNSITDSRAARSGLIWSPVITRTPDAGGWFSISDYNTDVSNYALTALVHWNTGSKNGLHTVRLELGDASKNPIAGQSSEVVLFLDNTGIGLHAFGGTPTPLPVAGIAVKDISGTYRKCSTFLGSETIEIWGNFDDDHFNSFSLTAFGGNINSAGVGIGSGSYKGTIVDGSGTTLPALAGNVGATGVTGAAPGGLGRKIGELNLCTIPQAPQKVRCAYGISLYTTDRAIVGYVSGYEFDTTCHGASAFVTFDWDPAGC